jgi:hypothetical protein
MNCQTCQDHLCDLLYARRGEPLNEDLAASLKGHLQHCPDCAGELRELQQAQAWLDALDKGLDSGPAPPAGARAPVKFYASVARLQRRANTWRRAACGIAALSLLLLAAWLGGAWSQWKNEASSAPGEGSLGATLPRAQISDLQRLITRLEEQEKLLRLLNAAVEGADGRQTSKILELDNRLSQMRKEANLHSLHLSALQRDIDQVRRFLTHSNDVAQIGVP